MFTDKILKTTIPKANSFFSPAQIQKQDSDKINKNCPSYSDPKDLTWAAAKHFLNTEMPDKLLGVVPTSFTCFDEKGIKGCTITLKPGEEMLVFFTETEIHVQRPSQKGKHEIGFCKYEYSCESGDISFKKIKCVKTW